MITIKVSADGRDNIIDVTRYGKIATKHSISDLFDSRLLHDTTRPTAKTSPP